MRNSFYFTGKGDRVVCFHCGGCLYNWGEDDDPWLEHAYWFERCPFLQLVKGREFIAQVRTVRESQQGSEVRHWNIENNINELGIRFKLKYVY